MVNLKEILDTHEQVILDGSVESAPHGDSFMDANFDIRNYFNIDRDSLKRAISRIQKFSDHLNHPNSRTTPEITEEIRTYAEKLGEKRTYLSLVPRNINHKMRQTAIERASSTEKLFANFQEIVFNSYQVSKKKELKINDRKYEFLTDMVISLEKIIKTKKDWKYEHGFRDRDRSHDSNADEKIVSTLLYQSIFSEKTPVLATKDRDFIKLLGIIPGIIGSDEFMPYNSLFRKRITENPFKLYFAKAGDNHDDFSRYLNSLYLKFAPEFSIDQKSEEENKEIKGHISKLWVQFSYF